MGKQLELNQVCLWLPFGLASKLKAKRQEGGVSSGGNASLFINMGFLRCQNIAWTDV